jgi:hypothetical protein
VEEQSESRNKPAPEDWLTIGQLANALEVNLSSIRHRVEKLINTPEYSNKYGVYLDKKNRLSLHYDPIFLTKLKEIKAVE